MLQYLSEHPTQVLVVFAAAVFLSTTVLTTATGRSWTGIMAQLALIVTSFVLGVAVIESMPYAWTGLFASLLGVYAGHRLVAPHFSARAHPLR